MGCGSVLDEGRETWVMWHPETYEELQRDIKALKHEATGVETFCKLKVEGDTVTTVCKGDTDTINLYE